MLLTDSVFAQDKGYIGLSGGASFPIGDYSFTNSTSSGSKALTGFIIDLTYAQKIGSNFGISALLRKQTNSLDVEAIDEEFRNHGVSYSYSMTLDSENWELGFGMVGGYGSFQMKEGKISFDLRAMIGIAYISLPSHTLTRFYPNGSSSWVKHTVESKSTTAILIGAGFKYNVASRVCLLFNLDYVGIWDDFEYKDIWSDGDSQISKIFQDLSSVNAGLGVGYRL